MPEGFSRSRTVRSLFDAIASRYDLINGVITFGQIGRWRRRMARRAAQGRPRLLLDLGAGTGDSALAVTGAAPGARIVGVDLSPEMLRVARVKLQRRGLEGRASLLFADATALPFKDGAFDSLVNAFFLRHLPDLGGAFREFNRVLAPGGEGLFLELTQPARSLFRRPYRLWFERVVPLIGGFASGNRRAYQYLPDSLVPFPDAQELGKLLREAGFEAVSWRLMGLGAVALHSGRKTQECPPGKAES